MKFKHYIFIIVAILLVIGVIALYSTAVANAGNRPEQFKLIDRIDISDVGGEQMYTDLIYDTKTLVVYLRTYGINRYSLTPYIMLDSFGCMTVGKYDPKTETIVPAEAFFYDEDEDLEAFG